MECSRCNKKITSNLPWILYRVEKLIKHVSLKIQNSSQHTEESSRLEFLNKKSTEKDFSFNKNSTGSQSKELLRVNLDEPKIYLGKLEKVDAFAVSDDKPGIQIFLEVNFQKTQKRFFYPSKRQKVLKDRRKCFPLIHLSEFTGNPIVEILRPSQISINCLYKQEFKSAKKTDSAFPLLSLYPKSFAFILASIFIPTCSIVEKEQPPLPLEESRLPLQDSQKSEELQDFQEYQQSQDLQQTQSSLESKDFQQLQKSQLCVKTVETYEKQILEVNFNSLCNLIQDAERFDEAEQFEEENEILKEISRKQAYENLVQNSNICSNVLKLVENLLKEVKFKKMRLQQTRGLESEVKGLRDLMLEVHKNQIRLSKLLLKKGILSPPIIKLTDPSVLKEESLTVKKAELAETPKKKSPSFEALQVKVDELKRKCGVKNRMIVTILKGLRSNIPKEWWEELVDYIFDESKPIEKFDPEKVSEFIRQTSLFLLDNDKTKSEQASGSRAEESPSEEEPKSRSSVRAEVEDALKTILFHDNELTESADFTEDRTESVRRLAFAARKGPVVDTTAETVLSKLEDQIVLLNGENERLWQQINDLQDLLKTSINKVEAKGMGKSGSGQLSDVIKPTPKKTINLTIQIGDKSIRQVSNDKIVKISTNGDNPTNSTSNSDEKSGSSLSNKVSDENVNVTETIEEPKMERSYESNHRLQYRPKSKRRHSENDLNYLEDLSPVYMMSSAVVQPRSRSHCSRNHGTIARNEVGQMNDDPENSKSMLWGVYRTGSSSGLSRKRVKFGYLLQKPSDVELSEKHDMGMSVTMSRERELQTIPENDHSDSYPSSSSNKSMSQAIQRLKTRVRSMHKNLNVLKLKNDKVDKILNKLVDDTVKNSQSFEKIKKEVKDFKNRLG